MLSASIQRRPNVQSAANSSGPVMTRVCFRALFLISSVTGVFVNVLQVSALKCRTRFLSFHSNSCLRAPKNEALPLHYEKSSRIHNLTSEFYSTTTTKGQESRSQKWVALFSVRRRFVVPSAGKFSFFSVCLTWALQMMSNRK